MASIQPRKLGKGAPMFIGGARIGRDTVASFVDVTLTNAEMLALRATPKTLVAAPGLSYVYREFVFGIIVASLTGAYTETVDNLAVRQTNGTGVIVSDTIETTGWLDQTGVKGTEARKKVDPIGFLLNKALVLHNTGDGELGGGNAANSVLFRIYYRDHNLTGYTLT